MPGVAPDRQSVFAAKQVLFAGPVSEPGAAFAFYLLVGPASLEVRAPSEGVLAGPTSEPVRARLEPSVVDPENWTAD